MIRLLSDENFNGAIVSGLLQHYPEIDLIRVQDAGLMRTPDADILEWAAVQGRVLLTHDASTVPPAAYRRVSDGRLMPGVFVVRDSISIRRAIAEISFLSIDVAPDGWNDQVLHLPM